MKNKTDNRAVKEELIKKIGLGLAVMILGSTIEGIIGYIILIAGLIIVVSEYFQKD